MRKLGLSLALLAGAAAPVAAQQMWQPEIGIRAGWTRFDDPNSTTNLDVIDFPGVGGFSQTVNPSSLYGIIPLSGRFALQPSGAFYNISVAGNTLTTIGAGIRLNVAITRSIYIAAGPNAYIFKQDGNEDTQGALEGAVGFRHSFNGRFRGSAEGFYEKREQSEALPKLNVYGVRLGFGYALNGGGSQMRRAGRPAMESDDRMWTPSIGLQGGWTLVSFPGGNGDVTTFGLPFAGQSLVAGSAILPGPSALSAIIPVGQRMAFEPSVDFHRLKNTGSSAASAYQLGARLNYAFNRTAYAGVGVEFAGVSAPSLSDKSKTGAVLATGLRFPIAHGLKGRTELNYRFFDKDDVTPTGQATSFVFGLLVPLK